MFKMDNYCVALIVLVLFLIYVDNQNKVEGFDEFGAPFQGSEGTDSNIGNNVEQIDTVQEKVDTNTVVQYMGPIGQEPYKIEREPPSSMRASLESLRGAPLDMPDYMLIHDKVAVRSVVPADLPVAYPRVGAADNLGIDTDYKQVMDSKDAKFEPANIHETNKHHELISSESDKGSIKPSVKPSGTFKTVIIYAPWCGWSKKSLPDFEKMDSKLNNIPKSQTNGWDVSCDLYNSETPEGKKAAKDYKVQGFPAVFVEVNGDRQEGPREYGEMMKVASEVTGTQIK